MIIRILCDFPCTMTLPTEPTIFFSFSSPICTLWGFPLHPHNIQKSVTVTQRLAYLLTSQIFTRDQSLALCPNRIAFGAYPVRMAAGAPMFHAGGSAQY
jgi:hypothetical protein